MPDRSKPLNLSPYGGGSWSAREQSVTEELGSVWAQCGINSEWSRLKAVLLHRPGESLAASQDPDAVQMLAVVDVAKAQQQHDALAQAYRDAGVTVHYVETDESSSPNQMFMADLLFSTPEGTIVARPASTVRAGEERQTAGKLARLGIPIPRSVSGRGTFEGADAMWISPQKVILGQGLRTNREGCDQVTTVLNQMGVEVVRVDLPVGTMHLMGVLRFLDRDLAFAWPLRMAHAGVEVLQDEGYRVEYLPDPDEVLHGFGLNFVTLGPREIIMPAGNPTTQKFLEELGVNCVTVEVDELGKAAGSIGCLTGVLHREPV